MLFNSFAFLVFATVFLAPWPLVRRHARVRLAYLVVASCVFYAGWDWRFLPLLLGTGVRDHLVARAMARWPARRGTLLAVALAGNLGILAWYKYAAFGARALDAALGALGLGLAVAIPSPILPVGISFFTFQSLSYVLDVHAGRIAPARSLLHYLAYLTLFPQLVAGPIVRASDLLPQLAAEPRPTAAGCWAGLRLVVGGYFMKVVLADNLAPAVNAAFAAGTAGGGAAPYWWLVVTLFAFQIYCDFAGYSLIARGLARWLGYTFPPNFLHPYGSASLRAFWSRWHISLSTWFRDYVYIPLGGGRRGAARGLAAMAATMLLSGLWHGAAWTFVLWGAVHAALLAVERLTQWPRRLAARPGGRALAAAVVTAEIWLAWAFFRAASLDEALAIVGRMLGAAGWGWDGPGALGGHQRALAALAVALAYEAAAGVGRAARARGRAPRGWRPWAAVGQPLVLAAMIAACIFLRGPGSAFIYFQF